MSDEVNGTAQNSAGNGDEAVLEKAKEIHFSGTSLAKDSDAAIANLIAEFRSISDADRLLLEVLATAAEAQIAARKASLVQGLSNAGFAEDPIAIPPNPRTVVFMETPPSTAISAAP
jgi:hypothetical protein